MARKNRRIEELDRDATQDWLDSLRRELRPPKPKRKKRRG